MCKNILKKVGALLLMLSLLVAIFDTNVLFADAATISSKAYDVNLYGPQLFLCNKKAGSSENGTEYFLTYTVKKATYKKASRQSLVGTANPERAQPYAEGGVLRYSSENIPLVEEGATYFIRFVVAKGGFRYDITRSVDGNLEKIYLDSVSGDATDEMQYFGLWLDMASVDVELTKVHCYDANGRDLGIQVARGGAKEMKKDTQVGQYYDVELIDQFNIVLSHRRLSTTKKMYIEYTVESAKYSFNQEGVGVTKNPIHFAPHGQDGFLRLNSYSEASSEIELLEVGASYIICIEATDENFNVVVQKMKGNKIALFEFQYEYGPKYDKDANYYYLWFGESASLTGSFSLTDVKFYDGNKNDLGVQCNKTATIVQRGELADYAGCEATYYCKANGNSMGLFENKTMQHTANKAVRNATYSVTDQVMKAKYEEGTEIYDFLYKRITDSEDNVYDRLYNYKVSFVTGTDEEIATQKLSNETGYLVMRPTDPTREGKEFEGWYTSDGELFDFETIVTESTVLYAKYVGEDLKVSDPAETNTLPVIICAAVAIVVVAVVVGIVLKRKRRNHGSN